MSILCLVIHVSCVYDYVLKLLSDFLGQGLAFLVKLASLQPVSTTHSDCHVTMRTGESMQRVKL